MNDQCEIEKTDSIVDNSEERFMKWRIYSLDNPGYKHVFNCDNSKIIDNKILHLYNDHEYGYTITVAYIPLNKYIVERIK